jgi:hypothetical protein
MLLEITELSLFKIKTRDMSSKEKVEYMTEQIRTNGFGWFRSQSQVIADLGNDVVPVLLNYLQTDTSGSVRTFVLHALEKIADTSAVDEIYSIVMNSDTSETIGQSAIDALSAMKSRKAALRLIEISEKRKVDSYLIVRALGEVGDTVATPYLLKLSDTKDVTLRALLTTAFAKIQDPRSARFLRTCLSDTNIRVVINAALTLGKISDEKAIPKLKSLLKDGGRLVIQKRLPEYMVDTDSVITGSFPPVIFDDTLAVRNVATAAWFALEMMGVKETKPEPFEYYRSESFDLIDSPVVVDMFKKILVVE